MFRPPVSPVALRPSCTAAVWSIALLGHAMCGSGIAAEAPADPQVKVVEVSGAGTDIESAKKDACREAVRQVVGAYVSATTHAENDELIEDKVISLSSGFVEKMETLKESSADGLIRVRIRATVRISKVLDSLKKNRISVAAVDGQSLGAQLLTSDDQTKGAARLIAEAFEGFPAKWFKASVDGKPRLGERTDGAAVPVVVTIMIEPDLDSFVASASKLDEAFKATERPHGTFEVDGAKCGFGTSYSQKDAGERLRWQFTNGHNTDRHPPTHALAFIDGRKAFPFEVQQFDMAETAAGPARIMPRGFLPVMFPVKFLGGGKRSSWKWHGVEFKDAKANLSKYFGRNVTCRTTAVDSSGEDIAVDEWKVSTLGIGGMPYWDGWELESVGLCPVVIAPAAVPKKDVDYLFPKFTCERTFLLDEEEVRELAKVSVALE